MKAKEGKENGAGEISANMKESFEVSAGSLKD